MPCGRPSTTTEQVVRDLEHWRCLKARSLKRPAHSILSSSTLELLAQERPTSIIELVAVPGVGPKKAFEWGEQLLGILNGYEPEDKSDTTAEEQGCRRKGVVDPTWRFAEPSAIRCLVRSGSASNSRRAENVSTNDKLKLSVLDKIPDCPVRYASTKQTSQQNRSRAASAARAPAKLLCRPSFQSSVARSNQAIATRELQETIDEQFATVDLSTAFAARVQSSNDEGCERTDVAAKVPTSAPQITGQRMAVYDTDEAFPLLVTGKPAVPTSSTVSSSTTVAEPLSFKTMLETLSQRRTSLERPSECANSGVPDMPTETLDSLTSSPTEQVIERKAADSGAGCLGPVQSSYMATEPSIFGAAAADQNGSAVPPFCTLHCVKELRTENALSSKKDALVDQVLGCARSPSLSSSSAKTKQEQFAFVAATVSSISQASAPLLSLQETPSGSALQELQTPPYCLSYNAAIAEVPTSQVDSNSSIQLCNSATTSELQHSPPKSTTSITAFPPVCSNTTTKIIQSIQRDRGSGLSDVQALTSGLRRVARISTPLLSSLSMYTSAAISSRASSFTAHQCQQQSTTAPPRVSRTYPGFATDLKKPRSQCRKRPLDVKLEPFQYHSTAATDVNREVQPSNITATEGPVDAPGNQLSHTTHYEQGPSIPELPNSIQSQKARKRSPQLQRTIKESDLFQHLIAWRDKLGASLHRLPESLLSSCTVAELASRCPLSAIELEQVPGFSHHCKRASWLAQEVLDVLRDYSTAPRCKKTKQQDVDHHGAGMNIEVVRTSNVPFTVGEMQAEAVCHISLAASGMPVANDSGARCSSNGVMEAGCADGCGDEHDPAIDCFDVSQLFTMPVKARTEQQKTAQCEDDFDGEQLFVKVEGIGRPGDDHDLPRQSGASDGNHTGNASTCSSQTNTSMAKDSTAQPRTEPSVTAQRSRSIPSVPGTFDAAAGPLPGTKTKPLPKPVWCSGNNRWLRGAAAAGWTVNEMARVLGCSPAHIEDQLHHLRVKRSTAQVKQDVLHGPFGSARKKTAAGFVASLGSSSKPCRSSFKAGRMGARAVGVSDRGQRASFWHVLFGDCLNTGSGNLGSTGVGAGGVKGAAAARARSGVLQGGQYGSNGTAEKLQCVRSGERLATAASPDLRQCSVGELKVLLKEAGADDQAIVSGSSREELEEVVAQHLPAWEVQRLLACRNLPSPARHYAALRLTSSTSSGMMLTRRVPPEQIRVAFRRLSLLIHPDKNNCSGANEAFQLLRIASDALLKR